MISCKASQRLTHLAILENKSTTDQRNVD